MPIKVAVFNIKGGVGKITVSVILTQIALMQNKKVLAIDQDFQNNFHVSIAYLQKVDKFKDLFTFKTSLREDDFNDSSKDWVIIDCPPTLNANLRMAIRNADFILIPIRPDYYSLMPFTKIREVAGDYKYLFQFPLVKVGFVEGSVHDKTQSAQLTSQTILARRYTVIGDLPLYSRITANISSNREKWWSVGLSASARKPFELLYIRLELLHQKLQVVRKRKEQLRNVADITGYYDDPENIDISLWSKS